MFALSCKIKQSTKLTRGLKGDTIPLDEAVISDNGFYLSLKDGSRHTLQRHSTHQVALYYGPTENNHIAAIFSTLTRFESLPIPCGDGGVTPSLAAISVYTHHWASEFTDWDDLVNTLATIKFKVYDDAEASDASTRCADEMMEKTSQCNRRMPRFIALEYFNYEHDYISQSECEMPICIETPHLIGS